MKNKEEIEKQRKEIRSELENIAKSSEAINKIMQNIHHQSGMSYRSLKPKSGEYIVHSDKSLTAEIIDNKGDLYEIQITKYRGDN